MSITEDAVTEREATEQAEAERQRAEQDSAEQQAAAERDQLAAGGATIPKDDKAPTAYVVVACLLGEVPSELRDQDVNVEDLLRGEVPGVPFIIGGYKEPTLFESTSGPSGAKRAALADMPGLAACVRAPGVALATWPARSYEFKAVEVQPQPDKLIV